MLRAAVILLMMSCGRAVAQDTAGTATAYWPANVYAAMAGLPAVQQSDTTALPPDSLFGKVTPLARYMMYVPALRDSVFYYAFSQRSVETAVYNMLDPERDTITHAFTAYTVRPLVSKTGAVIFLLGLNGAAVDSCAHALMTFTYRRKPATRPAASKATFSKQADFQEAQFELFLTDTDDSQWLEAEPAVKSKRKRHE